MKTIINIIKYIFIQTICITHLYSCSNEFENIDNNSIITENIHISKIIATYNQADSTSRLTYSDGINNGKHTIKTKWEKGDKLVANANPSNESKAYVFTLAEGENTTKGTFECKDSKDGVINYSTNGWTIYFPGDKIQGEEDFLKFTYVGQVQTKNKTLTHLKNYHTIRLICSENNSKINFETQYINFSGNNHDESSCMKFNINGLPSIIPISIKMQSLNSDGSLNNCFYTHNYISTYWAGDYKPINEKTASLSMELRNFTKTTSITAYMMMSNYPTILKSGSILRVLVTAKDGTIYYCDKKIMSQKELKGGLLHSITCNSWNKYTNLDGLENPNNENIKVLQEATATGSTDIIIMGDGFAKEHFGTNGNYESIMKQAYNDFFSVQPYKGLKKYFNVYMINAVSEDNHDAKPYYDQSGSQNGAIMGTARTKFSTKFEKDGTYIEGNDLLTLEYAKQTIRYKGTKGGKYCNDENEIERRVGTALIMIMVNVKAHAGTNHMYLNIHSDYADAPSCAYIALNTSKEQRKWTTIHEAGGHGFGKLGDEYSGKDSFNTSYWNDLLEKKHPYGIRRNLDKYWDSTYKENNFTPTLSQQTVTTKNNVYWKNLFNSKYNYATSEGLDIYEGGGTYDKYVCRPTKNSIMRNNFANDGHFFNAPSRWAIYYRLMRLCKGTTSTSFAASLEEFIDWDKTIYIENLPSRSTSVNEVPYDFKPTAPPVIIEGEWINGKFISRE